MTHDEAEEEDEEEDEDDEEEEEESEFETEDEGAPACGFAGGWMVMDARRGVRHVLSRVLPPRGTVRPEARLSTPWCADRPTPADASEYDGEEGESEHYSDDEGEEEEEEEEDWESEWEEDQEHFAAGAEEPHAIAGAGGAATQGGGGAGGGLGGQAALESTVGSDVNPYAVLASLPWFGSNTRLDDVDD